MIPTNDPTPKPCRHEARANELHPDNPALRALLVAWCKASDEKGFAFTRSEANGHPDRLRKAYGAKADAMHEAKRAYVLALKAAGAPGSSLL